MTGRLIQVVAITTLVHQKWLRIDERFFLLYYSKVQEGENNFLFV